SGSDELYWDAKSALHGTLRPVKLEAFSQTGTLSLVRKLVHRPRRLRRSPALRNLVRETRPSPYDFVLPLFVSEKLERRQPIASMPGVLQLSLKEIVDDAQRAQDVGLQAVLLFGIPERKDEQASSAYAENGVVQKAQIGRAHV